MTKPTLSYGPVRDDDELRTFALLLAQALAPTPPTDPGWFDGWRARLHEGVPRVVRRGHVIAGGLVNLPMGMFFGGKSVPVAAITGVAIAPEHRGSGAATHLMRELVREAHRDGTPISALYPATQPLYRKAGYELAGAYYTSQIPTRAIDVRCDELTVRRMEERDKDAVRAVYTSVARERNGNFARCEWLWRRITDMPWAKTMSYVVEGEAGIEGYVAFTHQPEPLVRYELIVNDLIAATPRAHRQLLAFLGAHRSMAPTFTFHPAPADPFLHLLAEQETHAIQKRIDWMLRIVDVDRALTARGWATGARGALHLEVEDDLVETNSARFVLEVEGGAARVRRGGEGALRLHVRALATMYTGFLTPFALHRIGRLQAQALADLELAARLFAGEQPWMPDMF
jgi:predicted acetyltransferase